VKRLDGHIGAGFSFSASIFAPRAALRRRDQIKHAGHRLGTHSGVSLRALDGLPSGWKNTAAPQRGSSAPSPRKNCEVKRAVGVGQFGPTASNSVLKSAAVVSGCLHAPPKEPGISQYSRDPQDTFDIGPRSGQDPARAALIAPAQDHSRGCSGSASIRLATSRGPAYHRTRPHYHPQPPMSGMS